MKKLFTLLSFLFVITLVNAQRKCNIQATQYNPGPGFELRNGRPFDISVKLKNLGPDAVKATDTLIYFQKIDNGYIGINGNPIYKALVGLAIPVGAEMTQTIYTGFTLNFTFDGSHQFCTEVLLWNHSKTDSATDLNTTNNTGCATVMMNKFGVGINAQDANAILINGMDVFPNPTSGSTTLNYALAENSNVKITVKDLQGKEVMQVLNETQAVGIYEKSIDLSSLTTGIYFVEYTTGDKTYTSKLIKN